MKEEDNILKEKALLAKEAPLLFSMKKREVFRLKQGEELHLEKAWEKGKTKANPFLSAPNEIEAISSSVLETIEQDSKQNQSISPIIKLFSWVGAAAAVLVFVLVLIKPEKECETFACLLENSEISNADMIELIADEEDELIMLIDVKQIEINPISDQEVIELLEDPNLDIEDLWYE
ncbi:MAG: hypothetical protein P8H98_08610 [Flavobacteriales bacterium]|nr:hypothetical protein [Flavobacteriales bacterium]